MRHLFWRKLPNVEKIKMNSHSTYPQKLFCSLLITLKWPKIDFAVATQFLAPIPVIPLALYTFLGEGYSGGWLGLFGQMLAF